MVEILAERITVLDKGKVVEQGQRDQILQDPREPYTQRLIAAVPVPDSDEQQRRRQLRDRLLEQERTVS